jgi:hypothetical protein
MVPTAEAEVFPETFPRRTAVGALHPHTATVRTLMATAFLMVPLPPAIPLTAEQEDALGAVAAYRAGHP